jgi:heat shock protein HtpX
VIAVTEGLLRYLPRDQVKGVLAHEMGHVANRDILVMTIAAMIGAAIAAIANILQFSMFFGGGDDDDNPLGIVGVLAAVIVAPIAAMILQLAVSRQRGYLRTLPRRNISARPAAGGGARDARARS